MKTFIYAKEHEIADQVGNFLSSQSQNFESYLSQEDLLQGLRKFRMERQAILIALPGAIVEAIDLQNWICEINPCAVISILPGSRDLGLSEPQWRQIVAQILSRNIQTQIIAASSK